MRVAPPVANREPCSCRVLVGMLKFEPIPRVRGLFEFLELLAVGTSVNQEF